LAAENKALIREFDSGVCVLRLYGKREERREKNFRVIMHEIAQGFSPK